MSPLWLILIIPAATTFGYGLAAVLAVKAQVEICDKCKKRTK